MANWLFAVDQEVLASYAVDLKIALRVADTLGGVGAKAEVLDLLEHIGLMDEVHDYLETLDPPVVETPIPVERLAPELIWNGEVAIQEGSHGLHDPDGYWSLESTRYRVGNKILFMVDAADFDYAYIDDTYPVATDEDREGVEVKDRPPVGGEQES
jgi:hypothetical protein